MFFCFPIVVYGAPEKTKNSFEFGTRFTSWAKFQNSPDGIQQTISLDLLYAHTFRFSGKVPIKFDLYLNAGYGVLLNESQYYGAGLRFWVFTLGGDGIQSDIVPPFAFKLLGDYVSFSPTPSSAGNFNSSRGIFRFGPNLSFRFGESRYRLDLTGQLFVYSPATNLDSWYLSSLISFGVLF
ncbi:MAG: hypothetical protein CL678_08845 [Bdellovibrionaceae bacterium]|nr:hypothetical protein [Pseudobdellovibrionaceae bacterium]